MQREEEQNAPNDENPTLAQKVTQIGEGMLSQSRKTRNDPDAMLKRYVDICKKQGIRLAPSDIQAAWLYYKEQGDNF